MSKEFEEEVFAPCGEFHFSGGGSVFGVGSQDVESDSTQDGKVLWGEILAGSGVVLVEDDVERPVKLVLDAPIGSHCFEKAPWARGSESAA